MKTVKVFLIGMWEFRSTYTTHFADYDLQVTYDWGREWAHRLTFRRFEP